MDISLFNYTLPEASIAHTPVTPRDHAKLLLLDRDTGEIQDKHVYDFPSLLTNNDFVVFNETKVFPARIYGTRETGGKVEVLLLKEIAEHVWEVLGRNIPLAGASIDFGFVKARVLKKDRTHILLQVPLARHELFASLSEYGEMPLPPYIHTNLSREDINHKYQTTYAKIEGSVAAPTAGLHMTQELLEKIKASGAEIGYLTLHVGAGTFLPVKTKTLEEHIMHYEYFSISEEVACRLKEAKEKGKRIVSIGTTTTRVLETLAQESWKRLSGDTNIFIYPGYEFKFVDALFTNFHLPHSTLIALVSAFVSKPNTSHPFTDFEHSTIGLAYKHAISNGYRFYSFGDASFIY